MRILPIFFILPVREIYKIYHKWASCMKIKGAIIIHVKFRVARKLMILRCFIILYVQILSGFENWDIQDLTLRRYDTIRSKITIIEQKRLFL